MTEHPTYEPVDLRGLDIPVDPAQRERVVSAAMTRITAAGAVPRRQRSHEILAIIADWRTPALIAAALFLMVGVGTLVFTSPAESPVKGITTVENQLIDWYRAGYVPTNRDLLSTLGGVSP